MNPNWYVITGGPSAGKTTVLKFLEASGYRVQGEAAREVIDEEIAKGKVISEIRGDEQAFQQAVLERKLLNEEKLTKTNHLLFFDRGVPDSLAYHLYYGWPENKALLDAVKKCRYKKIFLLDLPPYKKDYARVETEEARQKIHDLLGKVYRGAGFEVVNVPVFPTKEERAEFILKNL